jgi:glycosyltransferase involved in cell wall biosynthesis
LLVSSDVQRDLERERLGLAPRRDYVELARRLGADIFDIGAVRRTWLGRKLVRFVGAGPAHALLGAWKSRRYNVIFSDSEHVGLFLGIALRLRRYRPRHVVLAHHLTPAKKHAFVRLGAPGIDAFIQHSEAQHDFAVTRLGLPPAKLRVLPYQVDTDFWTPRDVGEEDMAATAGLECRDYGTLLRAIDGLDLKVNIGAASNWSRKENTLKNRPSNEQVTVTSYAYDELRDVYARSRFVVVPLLDVDFQAGITTILEAMAMAKAVITTRTTGHCGAVIGPVWKAGMTNWPLDVSLATATGIYVEPADSPGLRSAMEFLLRNGDVARRLGANGRERVRRDFTVAQFASRVGDVILGAD